MPTLLAATAELPAGGGPFRLERLTVGVFHDAQPGHRLAVGSDRRTPRPLEAGQGWIMPAGAEGVCEYDAGLRLTTLSVDGGVLREAGVDPHDAALVRVGALDPLLAQFAHAAGTFGDGPRLYREAMEHAVAAHLAQVLRPGEAPATRVDDARLRRAVAYAEEHLDADLSVEALAREAAMSPFHFSRAFKAATGRSPLQFVIAARMDRARVLLRTSRLPVAEVAWRVGYADPSRFGQHFRRATGQTPRAYRG